MKRILAPLLLGIVLAAAGGLLLLYARATEPYQGWTGAAQSVEIPKGASTRTIGRLLVDAGVVRDVPTYRVALWLAGGARRLQAGEYRFQAPMNPVDVLGTIARGEVDAVSVTFPEGLTIAEMATIFEAHELGSAAAFVEAARNAALVRDLDPAATDLEGYLFPDTYPVPHRDAARRLVQAMVRAFERAAPDDLRARARARGLSLREWVTLASIVEKETGRAGERGLVAAVYDNRLRIGMALQCDPTVIYALAKAGAYTGNLRKVDLAVDSPYNTYRHAGLPPGPIASPGKASLEAAARPDAAPYLYFVSRNDGTHVFARTLDEHNRNVRTFQVEYFRNRRPGRAGVPPT